MHIFKKSMLPKNQKSKQKSIKKCMFSVTSFLHGFWKGFGTVLENENPQVPHFLGHFFDTNRYKIEVGEKMRKKRKACAPRRRERASRQVYPSQQNPLHDGVLASFY